MLFELLFYSLNKYLEFPRLYKLFDTPLLVLFVVFEVAVPATSGLFLFHNLV